MQDIVSHAASLNKIAKNVIERIAGSVINEGYLEQLYTFSHPFEHMMEVDVVYYYLLSAAEINKDHLKSFIPVSELSGKIAEYGIISYAIQRLRWKIEYTNVVYSLLSREFTLSELQKIYETILGKRLDKRNFRRKILTLGLLRPSGGRKTGLKARPAKLYAFRKRQPAMVKVF